MSSSSFQARMNFPMTKGVSMIPTKTDLASIWGKKLDGEILSPPSSPIAKPQKSLMSLLSLNVSKTPKKTLYCPPTIEKPKNLKTKTKVPDALYSNISFTAKDVPEFDKSVLESITYVYKGNENQEIAWENFKTIVKTAQQSVVATPNLSFHFYNGKCTAKAKTTSNQMKLEAISDSLPIVNEDKVIDLLDELAKSEKLSIFSTSCFSYSVVTPVIVKKSEMGSKIGQIHRVTFVGFMFPDFCSKIEQSYQNCIDMKKCTVVMY